MRKISPKNKKLVHHLEDISEWLDLYRIGVMSHSELLTKLYQAIEEMKKTGLLIEG